MNNTVKKNASSMPSIPLTFAKAALRRPRSGVVTLPEASIAAAGVTTDRDRLLAYARLCGFVVRDNLPATWLHVLTFPLQVHLLAADTFPFAAAGTIHLSNSMTQLRPVGADEPLHLRVSQGNLRAHPKGAAFDLRCSADVGGEPVWRGTSTYLARNARVDAPPFATTRLPDPVGVASQQWRLASDLGRRYAAVSGDINPIHLHSLAARAFGMKSHIMHGMWTHAKALASLGPRVPEAFDVTVHFTAAVPLPSTVGFVVERGEHDRFAVVGKRGQVTHLVGELR